MSPNEPLEKRRLLLNERAAAQTLSLTPRALQAWRASGRGPKYVRISARCIRYRFQDLERWIESNLRENTADRGED